MYSYITDPITKASHLIHSSGGKNVLKTYLKQQKGSAEYKSNKKAFKAMKGKLKSIESLIILREGMMKKGFNNTNTCL